MPIEEPVGITVSEKIRAILGQDDVKELPEESYGSLDFKGTITIPYTQLGEKIELGVPILPVLPWKWIIAVGMIILITLATKKE